MMWLSLPPPHIEECHDDVISVLKLKGVYNKVVSLYAQI